MMDPVTHAEHLGIDLRGYTRGQRKVLCPKCSHTRRHNRNEPCLSVNLDGEVLVWRCHHCGWYGPQSGDVPKGAAPRDYGTRLRVEELEGRRPRKVYTKPQPPRAIEETTRLEKFFKERGIGMEVVNRYGITDNGQALCFPYYRTNEETGERELVNVKHRWAVTEIDPTTGEKVRKKRHRMEAGAELIFYGLDDCRDADQVIVVEGEPDKLALAEAGITAVLSVPNGAPAPEVDITNARLEYLPSGEAIFERASTVVMAGDTDVPGQRLMDELARRIGREKCWKVTWPEGCKDANDTLMAHGPEMVRRCIADMVPYPVEGITQPSDYLDELWQYEQDHEQGVRLQWPTWGELARFSLGQLSIWTGVPGSGKSRVLNAVALDLAMNHGWKIGLFSPEYHPPALLVRDLIQTFTGKPMNHKYEDHLTRPEVQAALEAINDRFSLIMPERPTLDAILERARALVYREGLSMLIIDPWTEIDQTERGSLSLTDWIDVCLKKIRRFGRNFNVHVAVSAHPTKIRPVEDREGERKMPVVTPYDISDSRHWYEMADLIFSIWRDKNDPSEPVQVHVQKVRFQDNGDLGTIYLRFNRVTGRYTDVSDRADMYEDALRRF